MATRTFDDKYPGQPFVQTDNSLESRKELSDKFLGIYNDTGSQRFWQISVIFGVLFGIGLLGYFWKIFVTKDPGDFGYYAALFSFLMTTSAGAPMVAIGPRIANAHWRRSISRVAEIWTLIGTVNLIVFLPLLWVMPSLDNGRRSLVFYWEAKGDWWFPFLIKFSGHIWTTVSIITLIVLGIALLWVSVMPDLALIRDHSPDGWRKKWASRLSRGWIGSSWQWNWQRHRMGTLGALYFMMLVLTHFFISTEFLMVHVPGWIDSLYPITHAHNALQGGVATVMLTMFVVSRIGPYRHYISLDQFHGLGKLLLALSLLWFWFWFCSFMIFWYGKKPSEQAILKLFVHGPYFPVFLAEFFFVFFIPWWTMVWNPVRRSVWGPAIIAISVLIGTFLDRVRMYVSTWDVAGISADKLAANGGQFSDEYPRNMMLNMTILDDPAFDRIMIIKNFEGLPVPTSAVLPTAIDGVIILGFVSGAVFLYMMASRLIPVINIWEQKELLLYNAEVQFHRAKVKVMGKPR